MHQAWGLWLPSFKHYSVIIGWIPARPASCHSNSHTSIFCIWVVLLELLYCCYFFSPRCKSGLDFAWHWALTWLRHGLYESKCRQKPFPTYGNPKLCAIPDNKILANRVQKMRFKAVCWSNHRYYVTCGRHFNAVSYFVLWYFLICPTSSTRLLWLYKPQSVSALCRVCVCVFKPFVHLKGFVLEC